MVEPMSGAICLGGVAVIAVVNHFEKRSLKAQRAPQSLTCAVDDIHDETGEDIESILTVHVASVVFNGNKQAKTQLKVRVKYGAGGESTVCDTKSAEALFKHPPASRFVAQLDHTRKPQVAASFHTTCLFLANRREMPLRIRLMRAGSVIDHTIGTADLRLPPSCDITEQAREMVLRLRSKCGQEIGHLTLMVGCAPVARSVLRTRLQDLGAHRQRDTFSIHNLQITEGTVVDDSPVKRSGPVWMGVAAKH